MTETYKLIKYSTPSWTKEFHSYSECCEELLKHICSQCINGERTFISNGEFVTETDIYNCPDIRDIHSLLSTSCGCEYGVEEPEEIEIVIGNKIFK